MNEDSLKKRYAIKLLANFISGIIGFIIIAIVPKALGPFFYGQFVYLQQFFSKVIGLLDMGSSIAFFTKLSARYERKELITFYFIYIIVILIIILILIYLIDKLDYISLFIPEISINYIYMGFIFSFLTWLTQIYVKISDAYALTTSLELIKIGHKLISLLLLLFFIYQLAFDLKLYFYFNYIVLIVFLIIISWLFVKKDIFIVQLLNFRDLEFLKLIKEFIMYCHPLFVYSIVGIIAGIFDIWLLQIVAGSEQVGFYGLSYSLSAMCFLFTSAMTPIITREFSKSYEQKDLDTMKKLFYRYIPMLYSIAAYFSVFISIQSENILMIFTDENFKNAFIVLVVMAFYPIHQTYGQLSGSIFYATGQTKLLKNIALLTLPLGALITFLLIFIFELEAMGLAYKMILIQVIGVNIQLYFNAKFLNFDMKYFVYHQLYSIVFFVILAFIPTMFISYDSSLKELLVSGFIYTFLVIIFGYLFPQVFATNRDEIKINLLKVKQHVIKK